MIKIAQLAFIFTLLSTMTIAQVNQKDAQGKKQGLWIKKYPNSSVVEYQGTFKNDKPIGTFTYNYQSNKVKAVIKHEEKTGRSEAFFYYQNGRVMTHGIYLNMKKDSVWTSFNEAGRITMTETYKNDVLNGQKKLYWIPDDPEIRKEVVISIYNYKNGEPDGKFIEFYPNGQYKKTGQFVNNKREGKWVYFELNGIKYMEEIYKDGLLNGWMIGFDKMGKEVNRKFYYNGEHYEGKRLEKLKETLAKQGITIKI